MNTFDQGKEIRAMSELQNAEFQRELFPVGWDGGNLMEVSMFGIVKYVAFSDCLISLSNVHLRFCLIFFVA